MAENRNGRACYDLHLHTYWSYDATAEPEAHFRKARELGVRCITISDHHVLDGLEEVLEVARGYPDIRTIPSAELTVTTSIGAVDLVCHGFPETVPEPMRPVLKAYHDWQRATGAAISAGLQALGFAFSDEARMTLLKTYRPGKAISVQGGTHVKGEVIRRYCVDNGFIDNVDQYGDLMKRASAKVRFPPYPHVNNVVPVVKSVGALVTIAHPHEYFRHGDRERMDALREECRLDGVECAHPSVPPEFAARYRDYCVENGLFSTGGSDCHSNEDIDGKFAVHGGPDEWLDAFLARLDAR
jgi:predicted metal-dependent phosphoesterase TrpH